MVIFASTLFPIFHMTLKFMSLHQCLHSYSVSQPQALKVLSLKLKNSERISQDSN